MPPRTLFTPPSLCKSPVLFLWSSCGLTDTPVCLAVVAARLNPACNLPYDDIDLQHAIGVNHWFVCGYKMQFTHPLTEKSLPLFCDADQNETMLRIVVKANLTMKLAQNLVATLKSTLARMDAVGDGYAEMHHAHADKVKSLKDHAGKTHCPC